MINGGDSRLVPGTKLQVFKQLGSESFYHKAEIMSIRFDESSNKAEYYVHFIDFNKRLDEWINIDKMDLATIEIPPLKNNNTSHLSTPTKTLTPSSSSTKKKRGRKKSGSSASGNIRSSSTIKKSSDKNNPFSLVNPESTTSDMDSSFLTVNSNELTIASHSHSQNSSHLPPHSKSSISSSSITAITAFSDPNALKADSGISNDKHDSNQDSNGNANENNNSPFQHSEWEKLRRGGSMTQRPEEIARVKNIDKIELGQFLVQTWYFSSYPESLLNKSKNFHEGGVVTVYICEFCLEYFPIRDQLLRHREKCIWYHPPGNEIYRHSNHSFWEIDGHKQKVYSRNLCLLSKLFLDHKTLFYDVDPFMFYLLTENDSKGSHLLGYFSKEKQSSDNYNLACILTLPQYQRKGYGRFLIEFSYELTRREGKSGSPEKPLSDLGLLSYRSYWTESLLSILIPLMENNEIDNRRTSIEMLSKQTGFIIDDIVHTLQSLNALHYSRGQYNIVITEKMIEEWERIQSKRNANKKILKVESKALQWTPPVFTSSQLRFI